MPTRSPANARPAQAPATAQSGSALPSREQIELDIDTFAVMVRDGMVIACYALIEHVDELTAEFSCVAVHPDYQGRGLAAVMLRHARRAAKAATHRRYGRRHT